jgi:hypothetical protein
VAFAAQHDQRVTDRDEGGGEQESAEQVEANLRP